MPQQKVIERKVNASDEVIALIRRCEKANPSEADLQALRQEFDKYPELWKAGGDVFNLALTALIDSQTNQGVVKESMKRGVSEIKTQLGYETASGAERLLIEACALAWLRYNVTEYRYTVVTNGEQTIRQADYWERRLTLAQRRYLKAIETLAKVRRLALPVLQLNVAQPGAEQLNIATAK
jgi:hypothetical protein